VINTCTGTLYAAGRAVKKFKDTVEPGFLNNPPLRAAASRARGQHEMMVVSPLLKFVAIIAARASPHTLPTCVGLVLPLSA
jgi:hypothetical protein